MFYGFRFSGAVKAMGYRTFTIEQRVLSDAVRIVQAEKMTPEEGALVFVTTARREGRLPRSPELDHFQKRQRDIWEAEGKVRHRYVDRMIERYAWRSFPF